MAAHVLWWALLLLLHLSPSAATPMPGYMSRSAPSAERLVSRSADQRLFGASAPDGHGRLNNKGPLLHEAGQRAGQEAGQGAGQEAGQRAGQRAGQEAGQGAGHGAVKRVGQEAEQGAGQEAKIENYLENSNEVLAASRENLLVKAGNQSHSDEGKEIGVTEEEQNTVENIKQVLLKQSSVKKASSVDKESTLEVNNFIDIDIRGRLQKILSLFTNVLTSLFNNVNQNEISNILNVNSLEGFQSYYPKLESKIINYLPDSIIDEIFKLNATFLNFSSDTNTSSSSNNKNESIDAGIAHSLINGAQKLVGQYISGHSIESPWSVLKLIANAVMGQASDTGKPSDTVRANSSRSIRYGDWVDSYEQPGYRTDIYDGGHWSREASKYDSAESASGRDRPKHSSERLVYFSDAPKLEPGEFIRRDDGVVYVTNEPHSDVRGFTPDKDKLVYVGGHPPDSQGGHAYVDVDGMHYVGGSKTRHIDHDPGVYDSGPYKPEYRKFHDDNGKVVYVSGHSQPDHHELTYGDDSVVSDSGYSKPDFHDYRNDKSEFAYDRRPSEPSRHKLSHSIDGGIYLSERFKPDNTNERYGHDARHVSGHSNRGLYVSSHNKLTGGYTHNPIEVKSKPMNQMIRANNGVYVVKGPLLVNTLGPKEDGRNDRRGSATRGGYTYNDDTKLKSAGRSLEYNARDSVTNKGFSNNDQYGSSRRFDGPEYRSSRRPDGVMFGSSRGPEKHEYGSSRGSDKHEYGSSNGPDRHEHRSSSGPDRHEHRSSSGPDRHEHRSSSGPDRHEHRSTSGPDRHEHRSSSGPDRHEHRSSSGPNRLEYGSSSGPDRLKHGSYSGPDRFSTAKSDAYLPHSWKELSQYSVNELIAYGGAWLLTAYLTYKFAAVAVPMPAARELSGPRRMFGSGDTQDEGYMFQTVLSRVAAAEEKYGPGQQARD